jgi:hypothetical protein
MQSAVERGGGMTTRRVIGWLACVLGLAAIIAPGAMAAKPTFERIDIDETAPDEFLNEACGVDVTLHAQGHIIIRAFAGDQTGPAELRTINVALTATADGNTVRFRDVGADLIRVELDGTSVLMSIGQVPFAFAGVLMIDLETGEAILEPQHSLEGDLEEACAALTA